MVATPLTFGNHLKFGPGSYHNAKGRPTFLHTHTHTHTERERERASEAPRKQYMHHISFERGLLTGPRAIGSCRHGGWSNEGRATTVFPLSRSRLGVDRLVTLLGIDESLAFRAFDKTIIFGHWLSKTQKLALASRVFLLKKASTIS